VEGLLPTVRRRPRRLVCLPVAAVRREAEIAAADAGYIRPAALVDGGSPQPPYA
jgi:hypothetical protein